MGAAEEGRPEWKEAHSALVVPGLESEPGHQEQPCSEGRGCWLWWPISMVVTGWLLPPPLPPCCPCASGCGRCGGGEGPARHHPSVWQARQRRVGKRRAGAEQAPSGNH